MSKELKHQPFEKILERSKRTDSKTDGKKYAEKMYQKHKKLFDEMKDL